MDVRQRPRQTCSRLARILANGFTPHRGRSSQASLVTKLVEQRVVSRNWRLADFANRGGNPKIDTLLRPCELRSSIRIRVHGRFVHRVEMET